MKIRVSEIINEIFEHKVSIYNYTWTLNHFGQSMKRFNQNVYSGSIFLYNKIITKEWWAYSVAHNL